MGIQEKCYEWEKNWGEKPTGEQNSSQKTDDETAKKTAIDPTIDDCTVYCFFMYYWSDIFMQKIIFSQTGKNMVQETGQIDWTGAPELDVELLDVNEYSRPGTTLKQVNGIVIHYTANPGSSAMANRDYFEGLKDAHTTKASSHFIVGLEGEVVQCIPTTEIAYASNDRNGDTISIECCHPDDTGAFNTVTYQSMVQLTAWLCNRFGLTSRM